MSEILSKSRRHWSIDFLTQVLRTCISAITLYPNDFRQANRCVYTQLDLKRNSSNFIGQFHSIYHRATPVGLFDPQTCHIRRSIVIIGERGLGKEFVLRCIWQLAPDSFYIPSNAFEVEDFYDEHETGTHWPLAFGRLDDTLRKRRQKGKEMENRTNIYWSISSNLKLSKTKFVGQRRKTRTQISSEMFDCARRTIKVGKIPILVVSPPILNEWRVSAELAALTVLLQPAKIKKFDVMPTKLENIDICLTHSPWNPTKTAKSIVETFCAMNNGKRQCTISWKPRIWFNYTTESEMDI
ncbi:unnamed protein product [Rodentolepis nana]|uniref:Uncharacterized protein n=1 Tax=Rodentolepis nana TaxID=102285 RepID=A0A3P7S6A5_RODNA|nr:unnamed protein product [Rodentolepis nana]